MHAARLRRRPPRIRFAVLVGENGDEPSIAGIEIKMAFGRLVEIGLLEHERHAKHALPEIDRCLTVGSRERDVVYTLALELLHGVHLNSIRNTLGLFRAAPPSYLGRHPRLSCDPESYLTSFSWARR